MGLQVKNGAAIHQIFKPHVRLRGEMSGVGSPDRSARGQHFARFHIWDNQNGIPGQLSEEGFEQHNVPGFKRPSLELLYVRKSPSFL